MAFIAVGLKEAFLVEGKYVVNYAALVLMAAASIDLILPGPGPASEPGQPKKQVKPGLD